MRDLWFQIKIHAFWLLVKFLQPFVWALSFGNIIIDCRFVHDDDE